MHCAKASWGSGEKSASKEGEVVGYSLVVHCVRACEGLGEGRRRQGRSNRAWMDRLPSRAAAAGTQQLAPPALFSQGTSIYIILQFAFFLLNICDCRSYVRAEMEASYI